MFAYSSRMDKPISTKLGNLTPWNKEEISERSKFQETVSISSPGEGGSCSSELRTTANGAKTISLFRRRDYKNKGHNPKVCLRSEP